uniref:Transposase n=1 Tax=Mesocestoides corti TaxID=53468 RepID=A0A5K3EX85_MESCO
MLATRCSRWAQKTLLHKKFLVKELHIHGSLKYEDVWLRWTP